MRHNKGGQNCPNLTRTGNCVTMLRLFGAPWAVLSSKSWCWRIELENKVVKQVSINIYADCYLLLKLYRYESLFERLFYNLCILDLCSGSHCRTRDCNGSTLPRRASWSPLSGYQCCPLLKTKWKSKNSVKVRLLWLHSPHASQLESTKWISV